MREAFGVEAALVKGNNGIFDVVVDGEKVFSKYESGRFPDSGEVVRLLKSEGGR